MGDVLDMETREGRRAAFDRWSARRKRELGPLAGLCLGRTNTGGWAFSRHWPHLLCWSWSVWVSPYRGPKMDGPRRLHWFSYSTRKGHGQAALTLWFFTLSLHWQDYGQMAALGPAGAGAPLIHTREHA